MSGWKINDYFSWKSWARIQAERRDAELEKKSASPLPMLLWLGILALLVIACAVGFILSFQR